jgi:hypothetical protein
VESWRTVVLLPVGHRVCFNAETLGYILLKETQVETLLAEVVSQSV